MGLDDFIGARRCYLPTPNHPVARRRVTEKARCLRSGLSQEEPTPLMLTRASRGFLLLLDIFFDKLRQALDQPAAAANHVQPTFMLMFFQNVVQLVFKLRHGNLPGWTHLHLAPEPVRTSGCYIYLNNFGA
jgi:hypothetical protein